VLAQFGESHSPVRMNNSGVKSSGAKGGSHVRFQGINEGLDPDEIFHATSSSNIPLTPARSTHASPFSPFNDTLIGKSQDNLPVPFQVWRDSENLGTQRPHDINQARGGEQKGEGMEAGKENQESLLQHSSWGSLRVHPPTTPQLSLSTSTQRRTPGGEHSPTTGGELTPHHGDRREGGGQSTEADSTWRGRPEDIPTASSTPAIHTPPVRSPPVAGEPSRMAEQRPPLQSILHQMDMQQQEGLPRDLEHHSPGPGTGSRHLESNINLLYDRSLSSARPRSSKFGTTFVVPTSRLKPSEVRPTTPPRWQRSGANSPTSSRGEQQTETDIRLHTPPPVTPIFGQTESTGARPKTRRWEAPIPSARDRYPLQDHTSCNDEKLLGTLRNKSMEKAPLVRYPGPDEQGKGPLGKLEPESPVLVPRFHPLHAGQGEVNL